MRLVVADDLQRSRLTVFFRLLLALPHFVWIALVVRRPRSRPRRVGRGARAWSTATGPARVHGDVRSPGHPRGRLHLPRGEPVPGIHRTAWLPPRRDPDTPERQSRWSIGLRLLLALPALLVAGALGTGGAGNSGGAGVAAVCALLGWFAILALGRMPVGLRDLAAYGLGYVAQAYAYALLVTDRYPNSDPDAIGPGWDLPPHPVRLELEDDGRSRLTVFFRLLFAIPHSSGSHSGASRRSWPRSRTGSSPCSASRSADALHRFLAAYLRYYAHVTAFVTLVANPFPGFTGDPGYPVDIVIDSA